MVKDKDELPTVTTDVEHPPATDFDIETVRDLVDDALATSPFTDLDLYCDHTIEERPSPIGKIDVITVATQTMSQDYVAELAFPQHVPVTRDDIVTQLMIAIRRIGEAVLQNETSSEVNQHTTLAEYLNARKTVDADDIEEDTADEESERSLLYDSRRRE